MGESKRAEVALIAALLLVPAPLIAAQEKSNDGKAKTESRESEKSAGTTSAKTKADADEGKTVVNQADSPMVRAAKASSSKKGRISLTDADLDSAGGSVTISAPPQTPTVKIDQANLSKKKGVQPDREKALAALKSYQRKEIEAKISAAEDRLIQLEDEFYTTEDDDRRERLEVDYAAKRKELDELRSELSKLGGQ